jgi:erythromycin esterase
MASASRTSSADTRRTRADRAVVDWARTTAIPLATVEPRQGFQDIEALRPIIGDARIVSLGEATHGTREFFKLKHRVLEFCVAELGFTMFGIEANFAESLAVNAYVLDGVGNAADVLAGLRYWVWDTEEVLDLIEWMRWWNQNNRRKVKFYGFVNGSSTVAAAGLLDFLARVAPELAAVCKTALAPLTSDLTERLFRQLSPTRSAAVFASLADVLAAFTRERPGWIAATSPLEWHLARLHAVVLERCARFAQDPAAARHDQAMAENVRALLEAEGPDAKAVLWSHNAHAGRVAYPDENSMGKNLDDIVGREQVVIGCSFDRGDFQARNYPSGELMAHHVTASAADSFDGVLAQTELPLFALGLANAPREGAVSPWLASEMPMRSIGGIYGLPPDNRYGVVYTDTIIPRHRFDAVLFVAETTAARQNRPALAESIPPALPAPINLALSGVGVPAGWRTAGIDRRHAHTIVMSDKVSPRGGRAVHISRHAPWRWGSGQLIQKISALAWHGKRMRFAAAIRTTTEDVGAGALLFMKFLAKPDRSDEAEFFAVEIGTFASADHPVKSQGWATFAVEAVVPEAAHVFIIGLAMTGNGDAWFGDLDFAATADAG